MSEVLLSNVSKTYKDGTLAVSSIDLKINSGELMVLVGPSGCGKSSILRMIAGLEEISGGDIHIGPELVNDMTPTERNIAMVFQNYALYPHMTVRRNMAFSLRMQHVARSTRNVRVLETARILGLEELLDRRPGQLSGGQRQRVAMGRAIVRDPKVFLLDEPLSNLDAKLRAQMRSEIRELQQRLSSTMIFVTHDQVEAMTMADRIAVLRRGVLQQVGTPKELYREPANLFVADFIGSPAMNLLQGRLRLDENGLALEYSEDGVLALPGIQLDAGGRQSVDGRPVIVGLRPEHLVLSRSSNGQHGGIVANVRFSEVLGDETLVHADVPCPAVVTEELRDIAQDVDETAVEELTESSESRFVIKVTGELPAAPDETVQLVPRTDAPLYVFDPTVPGTPAVPTRRVRYE